ncbi:hypothetical protein DVH24_012205 [Malus domestica]|uniref:Uncharacterized protein n=1 Tax=Malus domestica TaxID=3750 RepID=A0A498HTR6_MALDO|nr:hypothetical protein DVH24_012205 [Malus domestica]
MDSTLFQLVKNSPLEWKQIDSEILTSKFKLILRNTIEIVSDLKENRVRCVIPKRTDLVVSFWSIIRELAYKFRITRNFFKPIICQLHLRLVTIELENVGGDLLTLDWKTSFELQVIVRHKSNSLTLFFSVFGYRGDRYDIEQVIFGLQLKASNLQSVHLEWGKGEVPNNLQAGKDGKSKGGVRAAVNHVHTHRNCIIAFRPSALKRFQVIT